MSISNNVLLQESGPSEVSIEEAEAHVLHNKATLRDLLTMQSSMLNETIAFYLQVQVMVPVYCNMKSIPYSEERAQFLVYCRPSIALF